ncbi:hypothetical protein [Chondromyces apiculatus]|nr:hypothetical protein [Chondromyces apiculatus]
MKAGAIVVVERIAFIGPHQLDLTPFRQLGRLVEDESPSTDLRLQRQRYTHQTSMSGPPAGHAHPELSRALCGSGPDARRLRKRAKTPAAWLKSSGRPRSDRTATCYVPPTSMDLKLGIPVWLLCGIIGAWIATTKGRGGCFWFLLCAILGPIGVVVAAVVSRTDRGDRSS